MSWLRPNSSDDDEQDEQNQQNTDQSTYALRLVAGVLKLADFIPDPGTHRSILISNDNPDDQPGTGEHGYDEVQQVVGVVPTQLTV